MDLDFVVQWLSTIGENLKRLGMRRFEKQSYFNKRKLKFEFRKNLAL